MVDPHRWAEIGMTTNPVKTKPDNTSEHPAPSRRPCAECGCLFYPRTPAQIFHNEDCKRRHHNRKTVRGRDVHDLLLEWRYGKSREVKADALTELCQIVAGWRADDIKRKMKN